MGRNTCIFSGVKRKLNAGRISAYWICDCLQYKPAADILVHIYETNVVHDFGNF